MSKEMHTVFQMLNFLHGEDSRPYNLTSSEQLMLIALAKYKGPKGLFPSYKTLSNVLKISRRHAISLMKSLISKNLITSEIHLGSSNNYQIKLSTGGEVSRTSEPQFTTTSELQFTPIVNHSSPPSELQFTRVVNYSSPNQSNYQSSYQSIYQSEGEMTKNEQKEEECKVGQKVHRSNYYPSESLVKYAQSSNKDLTSVLQRYKDLGKVELATTESHDKVFLTFLDNSDTLPLPPKEFTAQEAWLDARERIERGVLSYPTAAQEMIVSVIGWMSIKDAKDDINDPTYQRFANFYDQTRLSKTPNKVHNARNSIGVGSSKSKIESNGSSLELSKRSEAVNGNNGHIGNVINHFERAH